VRFVVTVVIDLVQELGGAGAGWPPV
jgi:hypothetical protein